MSNRFLAIILGVIVLVGGFLIFNNRDSSQSNNVIAEPTSHLYGAVTETETAEGVTELQPAEDAVVLVEYGDFQCPACAQYYPLVKQLKEQYQDQLVFQFRHFPLVAIHPNAMAAHKAAEAAAKQDKFWEMHDLLYERQQTWQGSSNPNNTFAGYAEELGLNMEQYNTDVASAEVNSTIQADIQAGKDAGATGTPAFILEGKLIENPSSVEAFEQLIQDAIAEKSTS